MTPYDRRLNPYITRRAQDIQIHNLTSSTIDSYIWHVDKFCSHFGKILNYLGLEDIRRALKDYLYCRESIELALRGSNSRHDQPERVSVRLGNHEEI